VIKFIKKVKLFAYINLFLIQCSSKGRCNTGEGIVEKSVRESGFPITELARRMKKSRRHIYNLFENPHLSLDEILQIGKIIHYDFSELFTEVSNKKSLVEDSNAAYGDIDNYWKNKYLVLLEKYNELLEKIVQSD
jgi:plasmid maintenance system antidote protein VapI